MAAQVSPPAAAAKCVAAKALDGQTAGGQGAAGVEAEPADPQHGGADGRIGQVVRRHRLAAVAQPLAQKQARRPAPTRRN